MTGPSGRTALQRLGEVLVRPWVAWATPLVVALATLAGARYSAAEFERRTQERFLYRVTRHEFALADHMRRCEQLLRGAAALFEVREEMSRTAWRDYVAALQLDTYLPGVLALGFTRVVRPDELQAHEASVRAEGFPDYAVYPPGPRDPLTSIVFIEPFVGRNLRAFGYDMYSDPVRRKAMDRARDTGQPSLTGKVTLVQETEVDVQPGFLVYFPVYRPGAPRDGEAQRRAALIGYVYSPFRARDLLTAVTQIAGREIGLELYDGDLAPGNLLFTSEQAPRRALHSVEKRVEIAGHAWTARFVSGPEFEAMTATSQPLMILVGGLTLALLLFFLLFLNVRSRRQAALAAANLAASRDRFKSLVDNLPGTVFRSEVQAPWRVEHVSQGIEALSGAPAARFLSGEETLGGLVLPGDLAGIEDAIAAAAAEHKPYEVQYRLRDVRGGVHWVNESGRVVYDAHGEPLWIDGFILDVSMRKMLEDQIQATTAYVRSLLECSVDPLVTISADGKITDVNLATEKVTGRARAELIGSDFCDYFTDPDKARAGYQRVFERGEVRDFPLVLRGASGDLTEVLYNASVYRDVTGAVAGVFAAARDVTLLNATAAELDAYRHHLEETVAQRTREATRAKEAAEVANVAKTAFLANVSHELRTPLNAVIGLSHVLLSSDPTPRQRGHLKKILEAGQHLLKLLNDVIDFSQAESNRLVLSRREFSLDAELAAALSQVAEPALRKRLEVVLDVAPEVPGLVVGDPVRFRQVLEQLVGNAVKFTDSGEVVVGVRVESGTFGDDRLRVEVRDTGPGLTAEQRERIFSTFEQADGSSTRRHGGLGLGLALVRRLVAIMEGDVDVESEPGKGSTFWFSVPLQPAPAPARPLALPEDLRGRRALVVDDHDRAREALRALLAAQGFDVTCASSGTEAVSVLRRAAQDRRRYAIAFLDAFMAGLDGPSTAVEIAALHLEPAPAVVLVTPLGREEASEQARRAGAAATLAKPFTRAAAFDVVLDVLRVKGAATLSTLTPVPVVVPPATTAAAPPRPPPASAPAPAVLTAADRRRLAEACRELHRLLHGLDFGARGALQAEADLLRAGLQDAFVDLRNAVEAFDFEGARVTLETACRQCGVDLGGAG